MKLVSFSNGKIRINPEHVSALQAVKIADPNSPPGLNFAERKEIDATRITGLDDISFTVTETIDEVERQLCEN